MIDRKAIRDGAFREARRIIGDAIEYRRRHPYVFYLFHAKMYELHKAQRHPIRMWWHRMLMNRFWAKTQATREASKCRRKVT